MEDNNNPEQIVKSIKILEGVLKTSIDRAQKIRVKNDISKLRIKLREMYPDANLKELENAVISNMMTISNNKRKKTLNDYEFLCNIDIIDVSPYIEDREINEASSILKYFEDRIWGILSDQHTKLDFSNSSERDALSRKIDECNRTFKAFCLTLEDIKKAKPGEYLTQLIMIRIRQGRLLLFDIHSFYKSANEFISDLIQNSIEGGTMILNPDERVEYADFEQFKTFENWILLDALKETQDFINEALEAINVPEIY